MIIDWINRYYKFFVLFFVLMAFIKVVATILFKKNEGGLFGFILIIFNWYSRFERELNDIDWQVKYMKFLNFLSILVYLSIFFLGALTLAKQLF